MSDSTITIIAIFTAAVLIFIFPLMAMADRNDDITELAVQEATTELVDKIVTTGVFTEEDYEKYIQTISATGNTYDVDLVVKVLDENPGKKTTQTAATKLGDNASYELHTSQILDMLEEDEVVVLKEGDYVTVAAKNSNTTISQQLKNAFYKVMGNDTASVSASHGGMVTVTGNK